MPVISIKDLGSIGVAVDAQASELAPGAWSDALNMRFRDGYAERFLGHSAVFAAPDVTPYYLDAFQTSSKKYWIHAGIAAVYADDGTTRTNITGTAPTGAASDRYSGGTLGGVFILNNGKDVPMFWGGTGTLASLTGWNANWRAASLRPFKNYLIALDITKTGVRYPHMVKWSHGADPGTIPVSWDEADATKDAGEQDLAETPDLLVDGLAMGDVFVVYKQRSMYAMSYIGQPFIWRFARLPGDYGALARGCIANTPLGHVVLTAGDLIVHQGQGARSILTGRMRRWLFNQLDSTNYASAFVTTNPWRNEVWVCFPSVGSATCTKALVWNWVDDTLGVRSLDNVTYGATGQIDFATVGSWDVDTSSWASDSNAWDQNEFSASEARLMLCSSTPQITSVDTSNQFGTSNVVATLERKGLALDAPQQVKLVRAVYPTIDAVAGTVVNVQVGAAMTATESPAWGAAMPFTVGSDQKVDAFASGRYLAVRYSSNTEQVWRIKSYQLDVQMAGMY